MLEPSCSVSCSEQTHQTVRVCVCGGLEFVPRVKDQSLCWNPGYQPDSAGVWFPLINQPHRCFRMNRSAEVEEGAVMADCTVQ